MDPRVALERIIHLLDRAAEAPAKVRAFDRALRTISTLDPAELAERARRGTLTELEGVGPVIARVITEALSGEVPGYLTELEERTRLEPSPAAAPLLEALTGDCHSHTDWSDGSRSVEHMARIARALGRSWQAITDHSPRLRVARGLSPERLRAQLAEIDRVRPLVEPMRLLTGIEVDILADGSLDQEPELLEALDIVVASAHSELAMEPEAMTRRLVAAVADPRTDILGHPTNRKVSGRGRPPSRFDTDVVFAACARFGVAVEINSRPDRLDPPPEVVEVALSHGCLFAVDTDAHAPGQLEWQVHGAEIAAAAGVPPERIINTWDVDRLLEWARGHHR